MSAAHTPVEIELKLQVRASELARLRGRLSGLAPQRERQVDTAYFDTADHRLARQRAALRLRLLQSAEGDRWVQTLKTGDSTEALSARGEWETPAPAGRIDPGALAHAPLRSLLGLPGGDGAPLAALPALSEVFRTRFRRTTWEVRHAGARIEVALDQGEILAGDRHEPLLELELELLEGAPQALLRLALRLCGQGHEGIYLMPAGESKAARGVRLASGLGREPEMAHPPTASIPVSATGAASGAASAAGIGVADAAPWVLGRHLLRSALGVHLANLAAPDFVHDARFARQSYLALTRAGVALDLLCADDPSAARVRQRIRAWVHPLEAAMRRDHFSRQLLPAAMRSQDIAPQGPPGAGLLEGARLACDRALRGARSRLDTAAAARSALEMLAWAAASPPPGPVLGPNPAVLQDIEDQLQEHCERLAAEARGASAPMLDRITRSDRLRQRLHPALAREE